MITQNTYVNTQDISKTTLILWWTLQIADTLGHRPLSVIDEGMSFIGMFWLSTSHWSKLHVVNSYYS